MKRIIIILIVLIIAGLGIFGLIYFPKDLEPGKTEVFSVKKGQTLKEIALELEENDLIRNDSLFVAYALIKKRSKDIKAGEYVLSSAMNIPEILDKLYVGERIRKNLTIIEGWNLDDVEAYFKEKGIEGELSPDLEGYIFPDTYEIYAEDSLEDILIKIKRNFDLKITDRLKEEMALQNKTVGEIIITASLIEKEVRTAEDKRIVSGILRKRLKVGMPLQIDATINYLTGRNSTKLTKKELATDSPYNTYKYKGLPPGPISNPGIKSIEAAIYPIETDYWFYLSAKDGTTIFSKTLKEHNVARQKYLK